MTIEGSVKFSNSITTETFKIFDGNKKNIFFPTGCLTAPGYPVEDQTLEVYLDVKASKCGLLDYIQKFFNYKKPIVTIYCSLNEKKN